jgi:hypothetical protein
MRSWFGVVGLCCSVWTFVDVPPPAARACSDESLATYAGGAVCQMQNLVNSRCDECQSNGNGGSVKCVSTPQGYLCGNYSNPAYHYRTHCAVRDSDCGGAAKLYLEDDNCDDGATYWTVACGRTYPNDYISHGSPGTCP